MAEGFSYSSLEDRDSSTTDPEHSASNRADDDLCDTPLSRGGRSFSEHEIADESVPQKVYLDSFGDKKRPRVRDNPLVRSPPAKNPDLKKSERRRRSSSNMEVDQPDSGIGYNSNFATSADFSAGASLALFPPPSSSSSRVHVPDLILGKKCSPNKNYDPKLRPGVTSGSLGPTAMNFSPTRGPNPIWNPPHCQPPNYNPNLRPGVTDLSQKYASGYNSALSPSHRSGHVDAMSSNLAFSRTDQNQTSSHVLSPRRKMIQRQVSDDGVEADREDECPDSSCTSPNRGQKKILKMKKTLDDKLYYRSTIEPIFLETCETYRILNSDPVVDVVALLKEKTREKLQFEGEGDVKGNLMHLITHPHDWLEGIIEHKILKSLNLVQLLISKFILSPVKASLPSILKGNVDAQSGAIPKFQPILYSDSPFNTCDEEEQREREKAKRISPRKKVEAMGLPKISPEDMKNLERVADRLIQECGESRSGACGAGQVSYC